MTDLFFELKKFKEDDVSVKNEKILERLYEEGIIDSDGELKEK